METSFALEKEEQEQCQRILKLFIENAPYIETTLLASSDGILLAGLGVDDDLDVMAAMSASLLSIADALSSRTGEAVSDKVISESKDSSLVCLHAGDLILTAIGKASVNIGLILTSTRAVGDKITSIIASKGDA